VSQDDAVVERGSADVLQGVHVFDLSDIGCGVLSIFIQDVTMACSFNDRLIVAATAAHRAASVCMEI
jgi:hypothetical protein